MALVDEVCTADVLIVGGNVITEPPVVERMPQPDSPGNDALAQLKGVEVDAGDDDDVVVTVRTPHPDSPGNDAVAQSNGVEVAVRTPQPDSPGNEALAQSNVELAVSTPQPDSPGNDALAQLNGVDVAVSTPQPDSPGNDALAQSKVEVAVSTPQPDSPGNEALAQSKVEVANDPFSHEVRGDLNELHTQLEILKEQVRELQSRDGVSEPTSQYQSDAVNAVPHEHPPNQQTDVVTSNLSGVTTLTDSSPVTPVEDLHNGHSASGLLRATSSRYSPASRSEETTALRNSVASVGQKGSSRQELAIACHPLLFFSLAEALRLIDLYQDECGLVYPLIAIDQVRTFATHFYEYAAIQRQPTTWRTFNLEPCLKRPFHVLEIILAIALVIEGRGSTHLSSALVDELESEIDHRPSGVSADLTFAEILTLMSLYQFYRDEEVLAWRTIGLAARIALEIGLHLRDPPFTTFQSAQERDRANKLFWCIYCLDRRWSFGTGLPFGIQEDDIDPSLPEPDDTPPYLFSSMIAHSRLGFKILRSLPGTEHPHHATTREETAYLTYQVQQWYRSLIPELQIDDGQDLVLKGLSAARNRLRVVNRLRKNQLLMLIHRRTLFMSSSIAADPRGAKTAVDLAKKTVTMLDRLRNTSEIYESHAVCFNYFLYSALTVILLAAYHAKSEFHEYCRPEFHMALELIGGSKAKSVVARKLLKMIKHLKVMGPDFGVLPYMEAQLDHPRQEPNSSLHRSDDTSSTPQSSCPEQSDAQALQAQPQLDMHTFGGILPSTTPNYFAGDYAVDGNLLSSELSDLFQAIDPTRFSQMTSASLEQQNLQPDNFHLPSSHLPNIHTLF
ncbi:hypothetical protein PV10_09023 [Exophiala mesophila]|uniref:Xylanolytic transcriptional activator regulatory domain-containing protein n=1 Tax=Exophiala mesophila TaxID=212818 RepID=A0A0D1XIV4_EXOME|nr:uncharacterized protein PV10_09023 [Exophiala mesophila]KIV88096.1 hypothetical protein PV10_09023 [Exophiala mesophila]